MNINLTRRNFILTATSAAGGLMLGIGAAPGDAKAATVVAQPWNEDNAYAANEIDAWIAIDPDDSILIRYQRSEMGQGSMTALPMMINEELHCRLVEGADRIRVRPTAICAKTRSTAPCSRTAAARCGPRKRRCSRSAPAGANA